MRHCVSSRGGRRSGEEMSESCGAFGGVDLESTVTSQPR